MYIHAYGEFPAARMSHARSCRESLAIPVTHCNDELEGVDHSCYSYEPNITCEEFPDGSDGKNIDFRNQVYFGQFRFIGEFEEIENGREGWGVGSVVLDTCSTVYLVPRHTRRYKTWSTSIPETRWLSTQS